MLVVSITCHFLTMPVVAFDLKGERLLLAGAKRPLVMDRAWVVMCSPDDLVQLKEQLLKPDDAPNKRKPLGRHGRMWCSGLGWRWAGVPPRRCWSGLSAIPLG